MPPNHDVAWYLYLARRVLDGDILYRDLLEINPPLIVWLNLPIAGLARLTGWPDTTVYRIAVLALAAGSLLAAARLLPGGRRDRLAFAVATAVALLLLPGYDFGQREHLALILLTPWVVLAVRRRLQLTVPPNVSIAIGLVGGVGLLLKPHLVAAWLGLWLVAGRRIRVEDVTVAALAVIYLGAVLLLTPDYLPLVRLLAPVYQRLYDTPLHGIVAQPQVLIFAAGLIVWALARSADAWSTLELAWLAVGGGAFIAVLVQGKGFPYHLYPVGAAGVMAVLLVSLRPSGFAMPTISLIAARTVAVILLLLFAAGGPIALGAARPYQPGRALIPLIRDRAAGQPILVLSFSVRDGFPIVNESGAEWAMGFPMPWVPYALWSRPVRHPVSMGSAEAFAFRRVTRDFVTQRPVLLIVESDRKGGPRDPRSWFDFLTYYGQDPAFARALRDYRRRPAVGVFDIYERTGASDAR